MTANSCQHCGQMGKAGVDILQSKANCRWPMYLGYLILDCEAFIQMALAKCHRCGETSEADIDLLQREANCRFFLVHHLIPDCEVYKAFSTQTYAHDPGCLSLDEEANFVWLISTIRQHLYASAHMQSPRTFTLRKMDQ
jgi:hypothetical protein